MSTKLEAPGTSLKSLVQGFVLTKQTEGKSRRTVEYYSKNLKRVLWYADREGWPGDARMINEWHIKGFLGYVATEKNRWGLEGKGAQNSQRQASYATVRHYFVVLSTFFNWVVGEGILDGSPLSRIQVVKARPRVVTPYSNDEIKKMLTICDYDFAHNAKFLGSRNRAIVLVLLDTGLRLSEFLAITLTDIQDERGYIKVMGKGRKERVVRIGKNAQKAVWRYLMYRPDNKRQELWLTEEGKPLAGSGLQSLIKRLKQRAGIESEGSIHRFRHTFALQFLRADRNVFNLQYLLGHSDLEMVRRYTMALGMEDSLRAHEAASPADMLDGG